MNRILSVIMLVLLPFSCFANDDWYVSFTGGSMKVDGISDTHLVRQMQKQGVTYSSVLDNKSDYNSFSIGKCANKYICVELTRMDGLEFSNSITVTNVNVGTITAYGYPIFVGNVALNTTIRQEASISATRISILGKLPLNKYLEVFTRLGVYDCRVDLATKIPVYRDKDRDIYLYEKSTEHGLYPVGSLGVNVKPVKDLSVGLEWQQTGNVRGGSVSLTYKF